MLAALAEATGWDPRSADIILGTSSGSIVASLLRGGLAVSELKRRVLLTGPESESDGAMEGLFGRSTFVAPDLRQGPNDWGLVMNELKRGRGTRPGHVLAGLLPTGRVPTTALRHVIEPFHPEHWPSVPLWIVATETRTGRRHIFGRSDFEVDVATAVEASCAIPGYFAPVTVNGERFVDGGLYAADNADLVVDEGLDVVVISSPLSMDTRRFTRSPVASLLRSYPGRRLRANTAMLRANGVKVFVLEPDNHVSRAMGVNAMAPQRLRSVVHASADFVPRRLAVLSAEDEVVLRAITTV